VEVPFYRGWERGSGDGEGWLNGRSNGGGGEWRLSPLKLGLKGDNYSGVMEEGRGSHQENEAPRARRREGGSDRGRVAMVGGRRRRRRFLKFTLFQMGGGNRAGCHRRAVGWAERASWAERAHGGLWAKRPDRTSFEVEKMDK
jgi:hypothetical protein